MAKTAITNCELLEKSMKHNKKVWPQDIRGVGIEAHSSLKQIKLVGKSNEKVRKKINYQKVQVIIGKKKEKQPTKF